ncbi:MAG: carbamoyltransferase HypF [Candidatus Eisenbacteria bacterium]|nr:carbamoyltransferase HypF [Candidatus Eisenbacteria bacterium]
MTTRLRIAIRGAVQGVGFRPFVYRLAKELNLCGFVRNGCSGVLLEVEGSEASILTFERRLDEERPPRAVIAGIEPLRLEPAGHVGFRIVESDSSGAADAFALPDIALCDDCLRELLDPTDRRFRYPFINCTNCGPRHSILESLPYDRARTSMRRFTMCEACAAEYSNPLDRRFHAQPIACPDCGPHLTLWDSDGGQLAEGETALARSVSALRAGRIVAVKGIGGFQLLVDAGQEEAVRRLRTRKAREAKPFALMAPRLAQAQAIVQLSPTEERLLQSPEAPIVLARALRCANIAPSVAPGNPWLGVMLPYSPLHHLLLGDLNRPVVATSGNLADEPIVTDEHVAIERLGRIADLLLVHDRSIVRPIDDSVVRVVLGQAMLLRRARGYAPLPLTSIHRGAPVIALGAHYKNTVTLALGERLILGQHVGDLDSDAARVAFRRSVDDLATLHRTETPNVAFDLHPDYYCSRHARSLGGLGIPVQHHHAHVAAVAAECELSGPFLGVAFDGTGLGTDGTIWGGELLLCQDDRFDRLGHLRPFRLPGGDAAARDPRRSAFGLLHAAGRAGGIPGQLAPLRALSSTERINFEQLCASGHSAPWCSSVGRLFDAVASLLDLTQRNRFEGEGAMLVEFAAESLPDPDPGGLPRYQVPVTRRRNAPFLLDWEPLLQELLDDLAAERSVSRIAFDFHRALAAAVREAAVLSGVATVVLGGGCFQNPLLLTLALEELRAAGFSVHHGQRVPPNDGGISVGQAAVARARLATTERGRSLAAKGDSDVPCRAGAVDLDLR